MGSVGLVKKSFGKKQLGPDFVQILTMLTAAAEGGLTSAASLMIRGFLKYE
jgi:hypothetical protein